MNVVIGYRRGVGPTAFVGEGYSDRYGALYADATFAKHHLVGLCQDDGVAFAPWETYDDVRTGLEAMAAGDGPAGAPDPRVSGAGWTCLRAMAWRAVCETPVTRRFAFDQGGRHSLGKRYSPNTSVRTSPARIVATGYALPAVAPIRTRGSWSPPIDEDHAVHHNREFAPWSPVWMWVVDLAGRRQAPEGYRHHCRRQRCRRRHWRSQETSSPRTARSASSRQASHRSYGTRTGCRIRRRCRRETMSHSR